MREKEMELGAEFDALVRDYKSIHAPPHLARTIMASTEMTTGNRLRWPLALASAASLIAVLLLSRPLWMPTQTPVQASGGLPTFSSIAAIKVQKPHSVSMNLSRVRSVPTPVLPKKPVLHDKTKPPARQLPAADDA